MIAWVCGIDHKNAGLGQQVGQRDDGRWSMDNGRYPWAVCSTRGSEAGDLVGKRLHAEHCCAVPFNRCILLLFRNSPALQRAKNQTDPTDRTDQTDW